MSEAVKNSSASRVVYLAMALVVAFAIAFVIAFLAASENSAENTTNSVNVDYTSEVVAALDNAKPENGDVLIDRLECGVCHRIGADRTAPGFEGIAERAAKERPPLDAAAYLYESIVNPAAYIVEGYTDAMPKNYRERLTTQEIGDLLAYLLGAGAR